MFNALLTAALLWAQDRPPQHERRQLGLPLCGRGELLGQAGPPDLSPPSLHDRTRLVGRGGGAGVEEAVTQARHGGLRKGRAASQTKPGVLVHRRL